MKAGSCSKHALALDGNGRSRIGSLEEASQSRKDVMKRRKTKGLAYSLALVAVALTLAAGTAAAAGLPALTGRIVYSCSSGKICVYELARRTNVKFNVSGVNPKFSADGARIVFQASSGIVVMNADGTGARTVSTFGGVPSWSPDGAKIAFDSNGIWVMNADGSGLVELANSGHFATWSPSTIQPAQIAFSTNLSGGGLALWSMNPDGTNARQILAGPGGDDIDVVWSSSGQIVFASDMGKKGGGDEIFAFNPATLALTRLTNSAGYDYEPAPSPNGALIAFASGRSPSGVYVMNADGSSPTLIISGGRQPSWGPAL